MLAVISNCWALLFGMALIMLGNGLEATLLGVRGSMEGFSTTTIGLVMSIYYFGLIIGCMFVPRLIGRVGHIRTFGALASLASTSILLQAIFVYPAAWFAMRFVTGFSYAGLYIVAESWLNESANNDSRGQLLSFYMLITLGGKAGGQMLLNLSPPSGAGLFVLVSIMVSLAVVPILLSATRAPQFDVMENVSILQLYRVSPLGIFGVLVTGMSIGAIYGMGPVYATSIGMSVRDVSLFMGTMIIGGFLFQYPLGRLSDRIGRRRVIIFCCLGGAVTSFLAMNFTAEGLWLFVVVAMVGGLSMPLYSLCTAHTNDYLTSTQMVAASGTLVLLSSSGAAIGSATTAFAMDFFGFHAFYGSIGMMLTTVALFSLWRATQRADVDPEDRGEFVVMTATPLSASLTPDVNLAEIEAAADEDADDIQSSLEELINDLENPNENTSSEDK